MPLQICTVKYIKIMRYKESPLRTKIEKFTSPERGTKNSIERDLTKNIFEAPGDKKPRNRDCSIVTLTGPDAERHINIYEPYAKVLIIIEHDPEVARFLQETVRRKRRDFSADVLVFSKDVFDYDHQAHLPPVKLIDLDFTRGWTPYLESRVIELIQRFPSAWVRITYNARSPFHFTAIEKLRTLDQKIEYRAVESGPGDPMVTAQFKPSEESGGI